MPMPMPTRWFIRVSLYVRAELGHEALFMFFMTYNWMFKFYWFFDSASTFIKRVVNFITLIKASYSTVINQYSPEEEVGLLECLLISYLLNSLFVCSVCLVAVQGSLRSIHHHRYLNTPMNDKTNIQHCEVFNCILSCQKLQIEINNFASTDLFRSISKGALYCSIDYWVFQNPCSKNWQQSRAAD